MLYCFREADPNPCRPIGNRSRTQIYPESLRRFGRSRREHWLNWGKASDPSSLVSCGQFLLRPPRFDQRIESWKAAFVVYSQLSAFRLQVATIIPGPLALFAMKVGAVMTCAHHHEQPPLIASRTVSVPVLRSHSLCRHSRYFVGYAVIILQPSVV